MRLPPLTLFVFLGTAFAAAPPSYPVLSYSTYLRENFTPAAVAVDPAGNIYLAGNTIIDPTNSHTAVLVVKLNPQGTQYLYTRFLSGSQSDAANAIAVDSAGNAYVAGGAQSPDFPVTGGGNLNNALASNAGTRAFVTKLDPNGNIVFSTLLGGAAAGNAQAVALTPAGQVVVSGMSLTQNFTTTAGAYSISNSQNHPFLVELDTTGTKLVFSATGIGGSALATDPAGNIYIAGTTMLLDYPTTPGAYQPSFPQFFMCQSFGPCFFAAQQGPNQYVTKVDPAGSKLIYSTSLSGTEGTTNQGLAVDGAGSAYVTGFAGPDYPFTVAPPSFAATPITPVPAAPFLSKLDPAGQTLLYSVPVGGAGVALDASGNAYVGGEIGLVGTIFGIPGNLPALSGVPSQCLPNANTFAIGNPANITRSAYAAQVDAASGDVRGAQFIGGSNLALASAAVTGSTIWLAGATSLPDFPMTQAALSPQVFSPVPEPGAFVGAVDFSQPAPPAGTPQIGCLMNSANLYFAGPAARYELLTIYGKGLGPATGVNASGLTVELGGTVVNFRGVGTYAAPLLYASDTQVNFAVPLLEFSASQAAMSITVNGVESAARSLTLTYSDPALFLNLPATYPPNGPNGLGLIAVALNSDGSTNSPSNPAALGSTISVFVNGLTPDPEVNNARIELASGDGWTVAGITQATQFVTQVNLEVPTNLINNFACATTTCSVSFTLDLLSTPTFAESPLESFEGFSFGGVVYVKRQ